MLLILMTGLPTDAGGPDLCVGATAYEAEDFDQAMRHLIPLAEDGDATAQFLVGQMYQYGRGVSRAGPRASEWYRKAAAQGHNGARLHLGFMYAEGLGVPLNTDIATQWFEAAALNGCVEAQVYLGKRMEALNALDPDREAEAMKWLRLAADRGSAEGQFWLGYFYAFSYKYRDVDEALAWYRRAANQGLAEAQYRLGNRYWLDGDAPEDRVLAYVWVERSAEQGHDRALARLPEVVASLDSGQLARARELASDWQPTPEPTEACYKAACSD